MISKLYDLFSKISISEFNDIVIGCDLIFRYADVPRKLRIKLVDNTFIDVWFSLDGEYSFHWEQREIRDNIYSVNRHDNAPHKKWAYIKTFPKHCHDGNQDNVTESYISDKPETALREFLNIVHKAIIKFF